jgi:transposase
MLTWLVQRNIPHDPKQTKPELYSIIKQHKTKHLQYILDTELEKNGHRVLRLPPYHPELNPIEKIWAQVKNWVASRNVTYK